MKERLITLLGGLFALYIVVALLTPPSQPDYRSFPLTIDRDKHGLALLYEWLDKNKIPLHALRERYDDLFSQATLPDTGNLMIVSLPLKIDAQKKEIASLRQWVAEGNTLLLLVAHSDFPQWAPQQYRKLLFSNYPLLNAFGFNIRYTQPEVDPNNTDDIVALNKALASLEPDEGRLQVAGLNDPALKSILVRHYDLPTITWTLQARETARASRVLLTESVNPASAAMWQVRIGEGNLLVSRYADLFSNTWLAQGDHARLFADLLQQHRSNDGYVVFDDMHQGLTDLYDPDAFYSDPRLHNTLWFLFAIWLLYLIGRSNRLAPPPTTTPQKHAADFIRAVGGLFARRLSNATTALGLLEAFFNEVRQQYAMPMNNQPVWALLNEAPRVNNEAVTQLQTAYNQAQQNKKQNLVTLHNQLRDIRKSLL